MTDLLITHCHVLQTGPTGATVLRDHEILVRGQHIEAVQPTGGLDPARARQVIDGRGMVAMPGLINTHAHAPMVIFRGLAEDVAIERWFNEFMWPLESNLEADDVYWGMLLALTEMIESGVTAVADHYFYMDDAARAVERAGTRALLGWATFGSDGPAGLERGVRFVRDWNGAAGGRIRAWLAPHAPYTCDDEYLRAHADRAQELGVGIHIHAAETLGQTEASLMKRGQTPVEVLAQTGVLDVPVILAHGCGLLPTDIEILARYRAGVAHAPKTYLKLAMNITPVRRLRAAGVPVGLATDGAVSNNTLDCFESLRLMAMLQKDRARDPEVMTIGEALDIAARGSAAVFGLPDQLGALTPGALADLILVDLSGTHHQPLHSITTSLVYNVRASDVQTVIVDGQVLMRDRQLLTLDKGEIFAHVNDSMARLAQRIPERRIQVYNP